MDNVLEFPGEQGGGQIAPPMPSLQPLYIFSLDTLVFGGSDRGTELERDEGLVESVADTLMALTMVGAETWVVSDRPVTDMGRTTDWMARAGIQPSQLYMGYVYGTETGMDAEDLSRLKAVFEVRGRESRWAGLTVYSVGEASRIVVAH
jgi:hypothetical protein